MTVKMDMIVNITFVYESREVIFCVRYGLTLDLLCENARRRFNIQSEPEYIDEAGCAVDMKSSAGDFGPHTIFIRT
jgi:hypothetical protein